MARRAQQGAVARCPWCEACLPQLALECPECRFPLTMAAADDGGFVAEPSGTTSTATPPARSVRLPAAGLQGGSELARAHGTRAHRLRVGAVLLGVLSVLILLSGIGAIVSTSSPGARSDREAATNLFTALRRRTSDPGYRQEVPITLLSSDQPSDQPLRVSTAEDARYWYGTARSSSGRCYVLVGPLAGGKLVRTPPTLPKKDPCAAGRARSLLQAELAKSDGP